ncbi:hypothetical protein H0H92_007798, partial [Tricholoma furcatifolium]
IHHCIKEWETSIRTKAPFTEAANKKHYNIYLVNLQKWVSVNSAVTLKKREKMFRRAWNKEDVAEDADSQPQLIGEAEERARKELEAYIDEDSESDSAEEDAVQEHTNA